MLLSRKPRLPLLFQLRRESLVQQPDIYFEAGDHEGLVHMRMEDFVFADERGEKNPLRAPDALSRPDLHACRTWLASRKLSP